MTDGPHLTPSKRLEQAARAERLARALRDNLHRRKEQTRAKTIDEGARLAEEVDGDKPPA
ncbi:MAG TPA: hypothetical protein VHY35_16200 [Stellaceae bacterium]|jgi:hypothetical protein|nr:hypothetical protein [Stellaceae bacterium]